MKQTLLFGLFLVLALGAAQTQLAEVPSHKFPWKLPRYPEVEFFMTYLSSGNEQVSKPNPKFFGQKPYRIFFGPFMSYDPPYPKGQLDFVGADSEGDHYSGTFQASASSEIRRAECVYAGERLVVLKDGDFAIGIRPIKVAK